MPYYYGTEEARKPARWLLRASVSVEEPNHLSEVCIEGSRDPPPRFERSATETSQHPQHGQPVKPGSLREQLVTHVRVDAHLVECCAERVEVRLSRYIHPANVPKMIL